MKPEAKERDECLQRIQWAYGTLRSATTNLNIGENIDEYSTTQDKESIRQQVAKIRKELTKLSKTL